MSAVTRPAPLPDARTRRRPPAPGSAAAALPHERPWLRLAAFTALGAYGLERWATLLHPAPGWRLVGLLGGRRFRQAFEPLVPGAHKVPNTNIYRAPLFGDDPEAYGRWCADQIEQEILFEGPETVAAFIGGFVVIVLRMDNGRPPDSGSDDDGAVV